MRMSFLSVAVRGFFKNAARTIGVPRCPAEAVWGGGGVLGGGGDCFHDEFVGLFDRWSPGSEAPMAVRKSGEDRRNQWRGAFQLQGSPCFPLEPF